jgi:tetratricopeptide (TPR) repeat protein
MIAYSRLGEVLGGYENPNIGDVAGARIQFQRMLDIAESLAAADPANKTGQMDLYQAHLRMGGILIADEPKAALAHLRKALDLTEQLAAADPHTVAIQMNRGVLEGFIGAILASQGQLAEGIARMRRAMAIDHDVLDRQPTFVERRISLLSVASDLAPALARSRDRAGVDALAAEAAPSLEGIHQARLSNLALARRPRTLFAFGEAYALLQDRREACNWFRRSVEAWREIESGPGIAPVHREFHAAAIRRFEACAGK